MKVGDKLIFKMNKDKPNNYKFGDSGNAYYYNKSYEIINITSTRYYFIDELGDDDFFNIQDVLSNFYIWDFFYTQKELRLIKLESL